MRDRLFFAGEATHETLWGTVGGAWESGERAAEGVLRRLGVLKAPEEPRPQPQPQRPPEQMRRQGPPPQQQQEHRQGPPPQQRQERQPGPPPQAAKPQPPGHGGGKDKGHP